MIRITDQYFWNVVFMIFFGVLVVLGTIILETESRIAYDELTMIDFGLITLASFRLIRLFLYDIIMKWFREQFYDAKVSRNKVTLHKPAVGPRRTIADLLTCPWCFGVWAVAMVSFFYLLTPYAVFPVIILALSAVATFLQNLSRLVARYADLD